MHRRIMWTYFALVIAAGAAVLALTLPSLQLSWAAWGFAVAALVAAAFVVVLPRGKGGVSVALPIIFAATVSLGPATGAWVAAIGSITSRELTGEVPWFSILFNRAQYALAAWLAGLTFYGLGGSLGKGFLADALPLAVAALVAAVVNAGLVLVAIALRLGHSIFDTWRVNFRMTLPNFFLMLPFGYLMVVAYRIGGWELELLFVAPLAAVRWVFALLVAVSKVYKNGIKALLAGIDARDRYTYGHSVRVSRYALLLARQLKLPEDLVEALVHAALLHDIGKLAMPDEVLYKPVRLNSEELKTVRRHPVQGSTILLQADVFPCVKDGILHHHERWDGQGYPSRMRAEDIPMPARVIAVADAYDAMTTDRPYRKALSHEQAVEEIRKMAGIQFDPKVAEAFLAVADRVRELASHLARRGDPFPGDVVDDLGDPLDGLHPQTAN